MYLIFQMSLEPSHYIVSIRFVLSIYPISHAELSCRLLQSLSGEIIALEIGIYQLKDMEGWLKPDENC